MRVLIAERRHGGAHQSRPGDRGEDQRGASSGGNPFVGAKGRMETELVPKAGYPIETVDVRGFQRRLSLRNVGRNLSAAVHAVTSGAEASRILKRFQPDIAIGTGGYVCGPVLRRAAKRGIPVLVHESNAFPGVTVKLLAKDAAAVMIADEAARKYLPEGCRVVVTGNPLRPGFAYARPGKSPAGTGAGQPPRGAFLRRKPGG